MSTEATRLNRDAKNMTVPLLVGLGGLSLFAGFLLHPADGETVEENFAVVKENPATWAVSHWLLTGGGLVLAVAGLAWLAQGPKGVRPVVAAALVLGAILTLPTSLIESTIAPSAAAANDFATYASAINVAYAFLAGFAVLLLASAATLATEMRARPIPRVALVVGAIALVVAAVGFIGAFVVGVPAFHKLALGVIPGYAVVAWYGLRTAYSTRGLHAMPRAVPA